MPEAFCLAHYVGQNLARGAESSGYGIAIAFSGALYSHY